MPNLIQVPFHGDTIWALDDGGKILVALKPIAEALGLDWSSQHKRALRDAILGEGMVVTTIPSPGGAQETACLPLNLLPGWLFGIDDRRIADPEIRGKVLAYKREAYQVLFEHFFGRRNREEPRPGAAAPLGLMPGHPDFGAAVKAVREARLTRGPVAALALWRELGLPWLPEMDTPGALAPIDYADPVVRFAREDLVADPFARVEPSELWPHFAAFCARQRLPNPGQASFFNRFGRLGFPRRHSGRRFYVGIRPKASTIIDAEPAGEPS